MQEILVYALAAGETERYMEQLLSSHCRSAADIARVKTAAIADGWHSFRIANFTLAKPDFTKTVNT